MLPISISSTLSLSLMSPSSCLCLLLRLPVSYILPSTACFWRQFVPMMWPLQTVLLPFIECRVFLSPINVCNTSFSTWSVQYVCTNIYSKPDLWNILVGGCSKFWLSFPICTSSSCVVWVFVLQHVATHRYGHFATKTYRGADKSLVQHWKEISYSDQDLQHYTKIVTNKQ